MTRESGLQMPRNKGQQVLRGLAGVVLGKWCDRACRCCGARCVQEEVSAALVQHLRMKRTLSKKSVLLQPLKQHAAAVMMVCGIPQNV